MSICAEDRDSDALRRTCKMLRALPHDNALVEALGHARSPSLTNAVACEEGGFTFELHAIVCGSRAVPGLGDSRC